MQGERLDDGKEAGLVLAVENGQVGLQYITMIASATSSVVVEWFTGSGRSLGRTTLEVLVTQRALPELVDDASEDLSSILANGGVKAYVRSVSGGNVFKNHGGGGRLGAAIEVTCTASAAQADAVVAGTWLGGYKADGDQGG